MRGSGSSVVLQRAAHVVERRAPPRAAATSAATSRVRLDALQHAVGARRTRRSGTRPRPARPRCRASGKPRRELRRARLELLVGQRLPEDEVVDVVAEVGDLARDARRRASAATRRSRARARARRSGLPTSNAKLPGCGPKKNSSSSAGMRAARARLTATVSRSSAAGRPEQQPERARAGREVRARLAGRRRSSV